MSPQVASTLLTVAAVILGAVIGAVTNLVIARRRERADARAAARMVEDELRGLLGVLSHVIPLANFNLLSHRNDEQWRTHQLTLARQLKTKEWNTIVMAYSLADLVGHQGPPIDDQTQLQVAVNAQNQVRQALQIVYRYAEPGESVEQYAATLQKAGVDQPPEQTSGPGPP